jgi:hypothetical protein
MALRRDGKPLGQLDEQNEFRSGTLVVEGVTYQVVFNSRTTVTVKKVDNRCPRSNLFSSKVERFVLHDDDHDSVLPQKPDLSLFQASDNAAMNRLAHAYIRPMADGGGFLPWNTEDIAFDRNSESSREIGSLSYYTGWGSKGLNRKEYWVVYVLNLFQYDVKYDDSDPDIAPISGGYFSSSPYFQGTVLAGRVEPIATLGLEGYRDKCGGLDAASGTRSGIAATTFQQVLITLGGMERGADKDGGIMTQGCLQKSLDLSPSLLNKLRNGPAPGSYESDYTNPERNRFVEAP